MDEETQDLDTTELQGLQNSDEQEPAVGDDDFPVDIDTDTDPDQDDDPPEVEPTQIEASAASFRPIFQPRNRAEAKQYLDENVDASTVNAIMELMRAEYADARGGETIADHYVNQIEQAAPGFITAQERTFIRGMAPQQQSDPGSIVFAAFMRPIQKATQTGNTVEAIDEICADWMKRRGKTVAKPAITPLPPSQRVGGASGGGGGTLTRPASGNTKQQLGGAAGFLKNYVGMTDREAQKGAREF